MELAVRRQPHAGIEHADVIGQSDAEQGLRPSQAAIARTGKDDDVVLVLRNASGVPGRPNIL